MIAKKGSAKKIHTPPRHSKPEDMVHVMIAEPILLRRVLLNSTLDAIEILKRYDKLKDILKRKQILKEELLKTHHEIRKLFASLHLRKSPYDEHGKKVEIEHHELEHHEGPQEAAPLVMETRIKLSPLEKDLDEIRNKLATL